MHRFHLNHGKIKEMVSSIRQQSDPDEVIVLLRRIDFYLSENIKLVQELWEN